MINIKEININKNTINFNKMIANKVGLISTESGKMAFINEEMNLVCFYYNGRPVIDPSSDNFFILDGIIFNPLDNKRLMKAIFDYFIENNTDDYIFDKKKSKIFYSAFTYNKPYVLMYGRCRSPYKNDKRSCISLTMSDGTDFTSNPYYNDSLKYIECIDFLSGSFIPKGLYDKYDSIIDDKKGNLK